MTTRSSNCLMLGAVVLFVLTACEPYRVEYRRRPAYHRLMAAESLSDREVLDDGTVVVYSAQPLSSLPELTEASDAERFKIREELEDGTVVLRALLPGHVIAHTLHCLRHEEYELLWKEMLSDRTKRTYRARGQGVEEFAAFFRAHRVELAKMLNRMRIGLVTHEVVIENVGDGVIVCRFWPQVATLFKFKRVEMVQGEHGLKLLMIK